MDLDKILNLALNKALIGKDRIKQVNSNEIADFVNKHLEAINYTRCCTQLKALDNDNFEDWIIVNGYTVFDDYYLKNDIAFSESDLIEIYNKEVMNL